MKYRSIIILVLLAACLNTAAQTSSNLAADDSIAGKFFSETPNRGVQKNMATAAKFFLGAPYAGQTLEIGDSEELVVNLRELDCMTLVENCLAMSRTLNAESPNFKTFCLELQKIRYRNGIIKGYASRLHYSTDWIFDNREMGIVEDITGKIGGKLFRPKVGFMSANPDKYRRLTNNPDEVERIAAFEKAINARKNYRFIPKDSINVCESKIKSGDIIGFTTSLKGLDISHLAVAYRENGRLTFIHASSAAKKVIINPEPLADYCRKIKTNTGIVVIRPLE
ncbi:MAG: DUF1460 domain-containing protein [Dysgonamonadaceae bacterium]|jgi:hypothetical protein|nr:DUF1460 domain-containing protein [Dysgonamonadaceae bacterium]